MMGPKCNLISASYGRLGMAALMMLVFMASSLAFGDKKKDDQQPQKPVSLYDKIDKSKIVWPQPP